MAIDQQKLLSLLESLPVDQLEELRRDVAELTFKKRKKEALPRGAEGGPADSAVQKAAAHQLKTWYFKQGLSLRQIGEILGVSDERVRRLIERLLPVEYAANKRRGRTDGRER